jgi:hypothetical protein
MARRTRQHSRKRKTGLIFKIPKKHPLSVFFVCIFSYLTIKYNDLSCIQYTKEVRKLNIDFEKIKKNRQDALKKLITDSFSLKEDWKKRQSAVDDLFKTCVRNKRFDLAEHLLNMHPSTEAIDYLATEGFKNFWREDAIALIQAGLTSGKVLSSLIAFCTEEGLRRDFRTLVEIRGTPAKEKEIAFLKKSLIKTGDIHGLYNLSTEEKIKLSADETGEIIKACVKNNKIDDAIKGIEWWGATPEIIKLTANAWFAKCLKEENTSDIQKAAEMRGVPISIDELKILAGLVNKKGSK